MMLRLQNRATGQEDEHPILLDALCSAIFRYLQEHPNVQLKDLLNTVAILQDFTTLLSKTDNPVLVESLRKMRNK
jgi:hypothetical protein